ncbi:MAG: NADH-quinone oxidoreductase subunit A [Thermoprotei archaeon]
MVVFVDSALIGFITFILVLIILPILMILGSWFLAPRNPNKIKLLPFESGEIYTTGTGRWSLIMQYYGYLLMFLIFDTLSIFIFLLTFVQTPEEIRSASILMLTFLGSLLITLPYGLSLSRRWELWKVQRYSES